MEALSLLPQAVPDRQRAQAAIKEKVQYKKDYDAHSFKREWVFFLPKNLLSVLCELFGDSNEHPFAPRRELSLRWYHNHCPNERRNYEIDTKKYVEIL
jgi:hypothetical protein